MALIATVNLDFDASNLSIVMLPDITYTGTPAVGDTIVFNVTVINSSFDIGYYVNFTETPPASEGSFDQAAQLSPEDTTVVWTWTYSAVPSGTDTFTMTGGFTPGQGPGTQQRIIFGAAVGEPPSGTLNIIPSSFVDGSTNVPFSATISDTDSTSIQWSLYYAGLIPPTDVGSIDDTNNRRASGIVQLTNGTATINESFNPALQNNASGQIIYYELRLSDGTSTNENVITDSTFINPMGSTPVGNVGNFGFSAMRSDGSVAIRGDEFLGKCPTADFVEITTTGGSTNIDVPRSATDWAFTPIAHNGAVIYQERPVVNLNLTTGDLTWSLFRPDIYAGIRVIFL